MKTNFEELKGKFSEYSLRGSRGGYNFVDEIVADLADTCMTRISECDDEEESENKIILDVLREIVEHGCASGAVAMFINDCDCAKFYQKYVLEMDEWLEDVQEERDCKANDFPRYRNMCWFAYEYIAWDVLSGFEEWLEEEKAKKEEVEE